MSMRPNRLAMGAFAVLILSLCLAMLVDDDASVLGVVAQVAIALINFAVVACMVVVIACDTVIVLHADVRAFLCKTRSARRSNARATTVAAAGISSMDRVKSFRVRAQGVAHSARVPESKLGVRSVTKYRSCVVF